tara:strand:- start:263 stop:682 length:420 start_codon:yes stop_codon:yes gene_type:complete
MHAIVGKHYAPAYSAAHPWTKKTGTDLYKSALKWHSGGRTQAWSDMYDAKPDDYWTQDDMKTKVAELNKRYDDLKISYDTMQKERAPNVFASNVNWRDESGGYGAQTKQDGVKIDQPKETKKKTTTTSIPQTYTGSASL